MVPSCFLGGNNTRQTGFAVSLVAHKRDLADECLRPFVNLENHIHTVMGQLDNLGCDHSRKAGLLGIHFQNTLAVIRRGFGREHRTRT